MFSSLGFMPILYEVQQRKMCLFFFLTDLSCSLSIKSY